jgi:hypothetical protein
MITVIGDLIPDERATQVTFYVPQIIRYSHGPETIIPSELIALPLPDGTFTLPVYSTNDPDWSPNNWNYLVSIDGPDVHREYYVQVPYDVVGAEINFSAILPVQPASKGTLYAPFAHGAHVLVLATGADVPEGTPPNTLIARV